MVLLTRGNIEWQKAKVNKIGIKNKFEQIIVTDRNKSEELGFLDDNSEEVIILNDKPHETIAMAEMIKKKVKYYIIKSKHSNMLPPDERVYELREVINELYGDKQDSDN